MHVPGYVPRNVPSDGQSETSGRTLATGSMNSSETEKPSLVRAHAPPHVRSWQTFFPRTASILRLPVIARVHLGGAIICVLYFALLLFAALYRTSIWTNPVRAAYVAVSQIPVVYLLATRNNVLNVMLGTAYDQVRGVHYPMLHVLHIDARY